MNINKINDIEVNDFDVVSRDFDAVIKRLDIENAKELLKREGYFVDVLWSIDEVTMNYNCTKEQANIVLFEALSDDGTEQQIYDMIHHVARVMNLKSID